MIHGYIHKYSCFVFLYSPNTVLVYGMATRRRNHLRFNADILWKKEKNDTNELKLLLCWNTVTRRAL